MQALLSQYVALHNEHQSQLSHILEQLRQYGYQAEYKGPLATEPLQLLGITEVQQASPCLDQFADNHFLLAPCRAVSAPGPARAAAPFKM